MKTLLLLLISLTTSSLLAQWVPHKGEGVLIIGPRFSYSDQYFDASGKTISSANDGQFTKFEIGGYFSIGLGEGWGAFTGFSFAGLNYKDEFVNEKSIGFTNPKFGIIKQFTDYPSTIIAALVEVTPPFNFPTNVKPELGGDFFEYEAALLAGEGFDWGYISLTAAYRYKANEFKESQIKTIAGGGVDLQKTLSLFYGLEYTTATNTPYRLLKTFGTLLYKITPAIGVSLGSEYILHGANVGIGPTVVSSLWYTF